MYVLPVPNTIKTLSRKILPRRLWGFLKEMQRDIAFNGRGPFSFDEAAIRRQINLQENIVPFYVDIGAQDGVLGSQTLGLAKSGWAGVAYEADRELYQGMKTRYKSLPDVTVNCELVVPEKIIKILQRDGVPKEFGFLNLDIDSFDFDILDSLLTSFRPRVICVEINEMIPPPINFRVVYRPDLGWAGDNFQGFSIQAAKDICNRHCYRIGELHYNNLLLYASPMDSPPVTDSVIEHAYRLGYVERLDRDRLFPWNVAYNRLAEATPQEMLSELQLLFADRLEDCELFIGQAEHGGTH